jgi:hypothetical protein
VRTRSLTRNDIRGKLVMFLKLRVSSESSNALELTRITQFPMDDKAESHFQSDSSFPFS